MQRESSAPGLSASTDFKVPPVLGRTCQASPVHCCHLALVSDLPPQTRSRLLTRDKPGEGAESHFPLLFLKGVIDPVRPGQPGPVGSTRVASRPPVAAEHELWRVRPGMWSECLHTPHLRDAA